MNDRGEKMGDAPVKNGKRSTSSLTWVESRAEIEQAFTDA